MGFFNAWDNLASIIFGNIHLYRSSTTLAQKFGVFLAWLSLPCTFILGTIGGALIVQKLHITNLALQIIIGVWLTIALSVITQFIAANQLIVEPLSWRQNEKDEKAREWNILAIIIIIGTGLGTYFYLSANPNQETIVSIGAISGLSIKLGAFIISVIIIPIIKGLPGLIFGIFAKEWWEKRKKRNIKAS